MIAKNEKPTPAAPIEQLHKREVAKRSTLTSEAFDKPDYMALLAGRGIDTSEGVWMLMGRRYDSGRRLANGSIQWQTMPLRCRS